MAGGTSRLFAAFVGLLVALGGVWIVRPDAARKRPKTGVTVDLAATIAEIEAGRATTPLIGNSTAGGGMTVTFLARSAGGQSPRIVSDVTGWGEQPDGTFDLTAGTMRRVGRTDWHSLQVDVAPRARIEYLIAYELTDYRLDPYNPRQAAGPQLGGLPASEFVMPGYRPPQEFADPPVSPGGILTEATVKSTALGGSYRLIIYTPPGYRENGGYPLVVILDLRSGQISRVLDWLIANRSIEAIVATFVGLKPPGSRGATGAPLRTFLNDELPRWMASRYAVAGSADRRAIIGISFGAKDALDTALPSGGASNAFGRLGLLIPGRRISPPDVDAIAGRRGHRLRVAILAGQYDRANLATARSLRQALADAGHCVDYTEVPEGHSASTWTNNLRVVLESLFGTSAGARRNEG